MKTTRRQFLRLGAQVTTGAALLSVLEACGSSASSGTSGNVNAVSGPTTIRMLCDTSAAGKVWQGAVKLFNQSKPYKITVQFDTVDPTSLDQKSLLTLTSGSTDYDVYPVSSDYGPVLQNYL